MAKKETLSEEQLAVLNEAYPVDAEESRSSLPRFGMLSKDITEEEGVGKAKKISVVESAGTFYTEKDEGAVDEDGKKVWTKTFLPGEEADVIIAYHRKQLRKYDSSLEKFITSPIYDTADQILPLYLDKQVVKRGTVAQLQSLYPALTQKGKPTSDLKEHAILYVLYKDEMYQMQCSISSGFEFKTYKRTVNPSTVITTLSSHEETFGTNTYRKTLFTNKRMITGEEFGTVTEAQGGIKEVVASDAQLYLPSKADDDFEALGK